MIIKCYFLGKETGNNTVINTMSLPSKELHSFHHKMGMGKTIPNIKHIKQLLEDGKTRQITLDGIHQIQLYDDLPDLVKINNENT